MNYKVKCTKILAFLTYLFPNWRIKNQILVIQFIFCSFVVLFTLLSYLILFHIVREMLISNHQNILVKKQLARSTNNNLLHYQWLTQVNLQHTDIQLYQIRRLYEFSLDENPILEFKPYQCLQQPPNDTIIQNSTFCYGIFGTQEVTVEQENLKQLSKVLTFLMPQLQSEIIQYVTTSDDQFFTFWPGYYFNNSYIPHNRLWYKGAINPIDNRSIQYTTPYLSQVGRVIVSKMIKLREDGVVSIHTKLPKFSIIKDQYTPQILDQTGLFYYTFQYENSYKDILYFNQSNQTGFNQQDLEQIMNLKNGEQYNNSCDVLLKNSVCIRDSYGKDYNFFIQDLFNTNLSILVKTESQKFENILYDLFQQFDDFKNQIKQNLYLLIATTIFLCCLFFIASNFYLQRPFDRLLHYSTFYIKNPQLQDYYYQMEQLNISQQSYSELFNQLYKSILNITSLQSKGLRNKEKTIIEKFQYPNNQKIDQEINKLLKYLWNQQEM